MSVVASILALLFSIYRGVRASLICYRGRTSTQSGRVALWALAAVVSGQLSYVGTFIHDFQRVADADASGKAALLSRGCLERLLRRN